LCGLLLDERYKLCGGNDVWKEFEQLKVLFSQLRLLLVCAHIQDVTLSESHLLAIHVRVMLSNKPVHGCNYLARPIDFSANSINLISRPSLPYLTLLAGWMAA